MKQAQTIGLCATIAAAIAVLLGAGTASAETTELFSGASTLSAGTKLKSSLASGTSSLLSDTSGELIDTCKGSTVEAGTTNTTGSPISAIMLTLDWSTCTYSTTTLANGSISITKLASSNDGTVSGSGSEVTILVFGFLPCIYGTGKGTHLGTLDGITSGNAVLSINATIPLVEAEIGFCPESAKWVANYTVTSPSALNVGS